MGVIETLSAGFSTVTRRPWLIVIPVVFDLLLWLGPNIEATPLISRGLNWYDQAYSTALSQVGTDQELSAGDLEESNKQFRGFVEQLGSFNLLGLMATPLVVEALASPLPSLINITSSSSVPAGFQRPVIDIADGGALFLLWIGLALLGMLGAGLYLVPIARSIQKPPQDRADLLRTFGIGWARLVSFFGIVLGLVVFVGLPVLLVLGVISLLVPVVGAFLLTVASVASIWVMLHLFFVNCAIFVGDLGVGKAIRSSITIVRRSFWSSMALVILVMIIQWGTIRAWMVILGNPVGVFVAILGNAYVATGLVAATLLFYRDRSAHLKEIPAASVQSRQ